MVATMAMPIRRRRALGCAGCARRIGCAGCSRRSIGAEGDPPSFAEVIGVINAAPFPQRPPVAILTPSANIQPWVQWMDQEFITGVPNKMLVYGAGAIALLAAFNSSGGARRR